MKKATNANNGVQNPDDQRHARHHLAERHQPREDATRTGIATRSRYSVTPRAGRHAPAPSRRAAGQQRRVGEPADLADPFEDEEDPDADPQDREAGALSSIAMCPHYVP